LAHSLPIDPAASSTLCVPTVVCLNVMGYFKEGCWPESDEAAAERNTKTNNEFRTENRVASFEDVESRLDEIGNWASAYSRLRGNPGGTI